MKKLRTAFVTLSMLITCIANAETSQFEPTIDTSMLVHTVETTPPQCAVAGETVHISIPADLDNMIDCINTYDSTGVTYVLDNDILEPKLEHVANNVFRGTFDGNNKIIWYYFSSYPLFFRIDRGAIVKNFKFKSPQINFESAIDSVSLIGTLAAQLNGGTVESVTVDNGAVIVNNSKIRILRGVGGLVATMHSGIIRNSSFSGQIGINAQNITGVGGIAGGQDGGKIESSQSSGTLYVMGESRSFALGGIAGGQYAGLITDSKSDMQIGVDTVEATAVGGIAGLQGNSESAIIRDAVFSGRITMWNKKNQNINAVGGIVGRQKYGRIALSKTEKKPDSQDFSSITMETFGEHIGGLVGEQESNGLIYSSYSNTHLIFNDSESIPSRYVGGLVGSSSGIIRNSYAQESITYAKIPEVIGGLVGFLKGNASIEDCYSAVETNNSIKGVVGGISEPNHAKCHNSYWDTDKAHSDESLLCEDGGRTTYAMTYYDPTDTYVDWKSIIWSLQQGIYPTLKYRP